jgi:SAM-dependent methyltransferase
MTGPGSELTPRYARYLIRLVRPFPNFDMAFMKPMRQKAVQLLDLKQGDRVLDVGCGMGGSFSYLVDSVGSSGEVVGVEISPEVVINARRRVEKNNWRNVQVIEASAQAVQLTGIFDGLIMFAAPDVYASQEALTNILPHLRENAPIVLFGAKTSDSRMGKILNPLLRMACSKLSFPTTPIPDLEPWRLVAQHVERLDIESHFLGAMFLASGCNTCRV